MLYFKKDFVIYFKWKYLKKKGNTQYKTGYSELLGRSDTPNNVG